MASGSGDHDRKSLISLRKRDSPASDRPTRHRCCLSVLTLGDTHVVENDEMELLKAVIEDGLVGIITVCAKVELR